MAYSFDLRKRIVDAVSPSQLAAEGQAGSPSRTGRAGGPVTTRSPEVVGRSEPSIGRAAIAAALFRIVSCSFGHTPFIKWISPSSDALLGRQLIRCLSACLILPGCRLEAPTEPESLRQSALRPTSPILL